MDVKSLNNMLLEPPIAPNETFLFSFEERFIVENVVAFCEKYYYFPYLVAIAYICIVFGIKVYMKNREAYDLKWPLVTWNVMLALSAMLGFYRTFPELFHVVKTQGFTYSICIPSYLNWKVSACWGWLFCCLKFPELVDTIFIVLRKRRLIFLHWYHHATVIVFVWYIAYTKFGAARYYTVMNFFAHSLVYTYYTLKSLDIDVPLPLTIALTSSQMLQMFVAFFVTMYAFILKYNGVTSCMVTYNSLMYGLFFYLTYFVLFTNYFYHTYVTKPDKPKKE